MGFLHMLKFPPLIPTNEQHEVPLNVRVNDYNCMQTIVTVCEGEIIQNVYKRAWD